MVTLKEYELAKYILENIREEVLEIKPVIYLYEKLGIDTSRLDGAITSYDLERVKIQRMVDDWESGNRD